ncbi:MAG: signal transduction histidine kinase [Frankiales bacterium]|nr:signal transduction histidine kinase [Frankiales bacterium]
MQHRRGPAEPAPYRGQDRRQQTLTPVPTLPPLPLVLLLPAVLVGVVVLGALDPVRAAALDDAVALVGALLLTGAGLLVLVRWRTTGLVRLAFTGVALVAVGVLPGALSSLAPLLAVPADRALPAQLLAAAGVLVGVVLWCLARRGPAVDAGARPARVCLVLVAAVAAAGALLAWLVHVVGGGRTVGASVLPGIVLAALWSGMAPTERRRTPEAAAWRVRTCVLLGAASAAGSLAVVLPAAAPAVSVLTAAAGSVALLAASAELGAGLSAQSARLLLLAADVQEHQQARRSLEAQDEERLHEVRNVLAGLQGATATLRKYEDRLDPGVRRRLEAAVSSELARLAHLVDPPAVVPVGVVDLGALLEPVVVAERELGAVVDLRVDGARVTGRAADVATVVSALLVNARRHAPGSPVLVRASTSGGETTVSVQDRGPGVPLAQREAVFERGERADAACAGSGLGLYTAKRLVDQMGGTLRVEARTGGGASFVLVLPSAGARDQRGEDLAEREQVPHAHVPRPRVEGLVGARDGDVRPGLHLDLTVARHDRDVARTVVRLDQVEPVVQERAPHGVVEHAR